MRFNTGRDDLSAMDSHPGTGRPRLDGDLKNQAIQSSSVAIPAFLTERRETEVGGARTERKWYALQVRPRFEKVVAVHLNHKGYEEYLPLYRSRRRWSDRTKEIELPLFPGYIFCRFDVSHRLPILLVPGVMSVVGAGKSPLAVSDHEITSVQSVVKSGLTFQPSPFIRSGQLARVERGPLRGLVGIVVEARKNCRLIISIQLLQRSVSVEIDTDSVVPVSVTDPQALIAGSVAIS